MQTKIQILWDWGNNSKGHWMFCVKAIKSDAQLRPFVASLVLCWKKWTLYVRMQPLKHVFSLSLTFLCPWCCRNNIKGETFQSLIWHPVCACAFTLSHTLFQFLITREVEASGIFVLNINSFQNVRIRDTRSCVYALKNTDELPDLCCWRFFLYTDDYITHLISFRHSKLLTRSFLLT